MCGLRDSERGNVRRSRVFSRARAFLARAAVVRQVRRLRRGRVAGELRRRSGRSRSRGARSARRTGREPRGARRAGGRGAQRLGRERARRPRRVRRRPPPCARSAAFEPPPPPSRSLSRALTRACGRALPDAQVPARELGRVAESRRAETVGDHAFGSAVRGGGARSPTDVALGAAGAAAARPTTLVVDDASATCLGEAPAARGQARTNADADDGRTSRVGELLARQRGRRCARPRRTPRPRAARGDAPADDAPPPPLAADDRRARAGNCCCARGRAPASAPPARARGRGRAAVLHGLPTRTARSWSARSSPRSARRARTASSCATVPRRAAARAAAAPGRRDAAGGARQYAGGARAEPSRVGD